ncbi:MAG: hypothetical protein AAF730_02365 [Bacteroidota bacterium]
MKQKLTYVLTLVMLSGLLVGCVDLEVENENNPNREQVQATAQDIETLVGGTFSNYWSATQWCSPSMALSVAADSHSCSWGNWGMRDISAEPRVEWNNQPSYGNRGVVEAPWFNGYLAISNTNDALQAIDRIIAEQGEETNEFTRLGVDVARLQAFSKFNQGLAHGLLALMFDRAFIVTEDIDLATATLELRPYGEVAEAAIAMLDEAIAIAQANTFTISADEDWIFGLDVSNERLIRLANSYQARIRAQVARTPEERQAVNWAAVISNIQNGITTDFAPIGNDDGNVREWDCMKFYGVQEPTGTSWSRADYRQIGPADESGGYQNWLNTPVAEREVFDIVTSDRRIQGPDGVDSDGKYFSYFGNAASFRPDRGTYHFSSHAPIRWIDYRLANANGPMHVMLTSEMDLLHAEALLHTGGSKALIAELLNNTRVPNGELNPATEGDATGSLSDAQSHLDSASLWAKMKHEKRIETMLTAAGLDFFDDRGWGDLVADTPVQFPIPGDELGTLGLQLYTFGGPGGDSSAPKRGALATTSEWERNSRSF